MQIITCTHKTHIITFVINIIFTKLYKSQIIFINFFFLKIIPKLKKMIFNNNSIKQ